MAAVFRDRKGVLMVEFMQQGTTITSQVCCGTLEKLCRVIQNKRRGMLTSGVVLPHDNAHSHTAAHTEHCWSISTGSCLTTLFTALISLWATTTCSPTWRTGCNHSASTMRCWWKVRKSGWAHRQQTSLTQVHKNLLPNTRIASISAETWRLHWEVA
jgi:hypothetical protein